MNFSEFKKLLGADPGNREPETLRARASGPEFEQAAQEAEAFERKLESAAKLPVDEETLVADILSAPRDAGRRMPSWMAIAAGLVIATGVFLFIERDGFIQPDTIEEYVAQHYHHDGERLMAKAVAPVGMQKVERIMHDWDLEASPDLVAKVVYIRRCVTMDGWGAHMIVRTEQGLLNLLVMPKTPVHDRQFIEFDGMQAHLVSLGDASAAIIGRPDQHVASLDSLVRSAITPLG